MFLMENIVNNEYNIDLLCIYSTHILYHVHERYKFHFNDPTIWFAARTTLDRWLNPSAL